MNVSAKPKEVTVRVVRTNADGTRVDLGVVCRWRRPALTLLALLIVALGLLLATDPSGLVWVAGYTIVFTNAGRAITTNRLIGSGTEPKYIAWGTGAGTPAAADTTLFSESADESRVAGTSSRQTTNYAADTYRVTGTITCANPKTITNMGLFDASTDGNLFMKGNFADETLGVGDSLTFTCDVVY